MPACSMDSRCRRWMLPALAALLVLYTAPDAVAQNGPTLTIVGGTSSYDLSGTGTSWVAGGAAGYPVIRHVDLEAGMRLFRYGTQFDEDVSYVFPEATVLMALPVNRFRAFLGAGLGGAIGIGGRTDHEFTLHGALGADIRLDPWLDTSLRLRPEFRVRSVDPWVGSMGDFTLGVTYHP